MNSKNRFYYTEFIKDSARGSNPRGFVIQALPWVHADKASPPARLVTAQLFFRNF